jgi:hypothetical protein
MYNNIVTLCKFVCGWEMSVKGKKQWPAPQPKTLIIMIMTLTLGVNFTLQQNYVTIFFPAQVELAFTRP